MFLFFTVAGLVTYECSVEASFSLTLTSGDCMYFFTKKTVTFRVKMTHDRLTDVSLCTATSNASDIYLEACCPTDPSELTP